jgi:hypothetical protein
LGSNPNSSGTYALGGTGVLTTGSEIIGQTGVGVFNQTGGTHTVNGDMQLGQMSGTGTYTLSAGTLNVASGKLNVGDSGSGKLEVDGGSLKVGNLSVKGSGTLVIGSPSADIRVLGSLYFDTNAHLAAAPGSQVHMAGASFENSSTTATSLADLAKLTLLIEGGTSRHSTVEVQSKDMGPSPAGFGANFALGGLVLGGEDVGWVQLVDGYYNADRNTPGALYVNSLTLGAGSTLDLNHFNLYYHQFTNLGGSVLNGTPQFVTPEPATLTLLFLGGMGVLVRRKRR